VVAVRLPEANQSARHAAVDRLEVEAEVTAAAVVEEGDPPAPPVGRRVEAEADHAIEQLLGFRDGVETRKHPIELQGLERHRILAVAPAVEPSEGAWQVQRELGLEPVQLPLGRWRLQ
jgi:hypothetical protein